MTSFDVWPPVRIVGTGSYVPERVVTNADLIATGLDTTDKWVREHTGIRERRFASDDEFTSTMAAAAARRCIDSADAFLEDVDLVIVATSSPDWVQPATASAVHHQLGMRADAGAVDVNAVCSGFVYALHMGTSMLAGSDSWNSVLVIGAECYSRLTNPADRTTRIFFGDGAGAVLLRKELELADIAMVAAHEAGMELPQLEDVDGGADEDETPGIRSIVFHTDHEAKDAIIVPGGGTRDPDASREQRYFHMDGPAVKEFAVQAVVVGTEDACRDAGMFAADLNLFVPHQSNLRMMEAAVDHLGLPEARLASTVAKYGNTAAASIPITLDEAVRAGRVSEGDMVALSGYGGGLASASCVVRW